MEIDIREAINYLIETRPWEAIAFLVLLGTALVEGVIEVLKDLTYYKEDDTRLTGDHRGSR